MTQPEGHAWSLPPARGLPSLEGVLYLPPGEAKGLPLVVFSPDLLLPRSWGFYPFLASQVGAVHPFLLYNPSLSGFRGEETLLAEPEKVALYTPRKELSDLDRILEALEEGRLPGAGRIDPGKVFLSGHGKGAALALLAAEGNPKVRGVLCMSALSTLLRFSPGNREEMQEKGFLEVEAPLSGQKVRLSREFLEEVEREKEALSLQRAVHALEIPLVFMHGEEDLEVSVKESESLYHWSRKDRTRLVLMEKVGHGFGGEHPFKHSNKELDRVVEIFVNFVDQVLESRQGPTGS